MNENTKLNVSNLVTELIDNFMNSNGNNLLTVCIRKESNGISVHEIPENLMINILYATGAVKQ